MINHISASTRKRWYGVSNFVDPFDFTHLLLSPIYYYYDRPQNVCAWEFITCIGISAPLKPQCWCHRSTQRGIYTAITTVLQWHGGVVVSVTNLYYCTYGVWFVVPTTFYVPSFLVLKSDIVTWSTFWRLTSVLRRVILGLSALLYTGTVVGFMARNQVRYRWTHTVLNRCGECYGTGPYTSFYWFYVS